MGWLNSSRTKYIWNHEVTLTPGKDNKGCQPSCCPQTRSLTWKSSSDRPYAGRHRETGATFPFVKTPLSATFSPLHPKPHGPALQIRVPWPTSDSLPWQYVVSLSRDNCLTSWELWQSEWKREGSTCERSAGLRTNVVTKKKKQININLRHQLDIFYIIQKMMLYLNRDPNHNKIFSPLKDPSFPLSSFLLKGSFSSPVSPSVCS